VECGPKKYRPAIQQSETKSKLFTGYSPPNITKNQRTDHRHYKAIKTKEIRGETERSRRIGRQVSFQRLGCYLEPATGKKGQRRRRRQYRRNLGPAARTGAVFPIFTMQKGDARQKRTQSPSGSAWMPENSSRILTVKNGHFLYHTGQLNRDPGTKTILKR